MQRTSSLEKAQMLRNAEKGGYKVKKTTSSKIDWLDYTDNECIIERTERPS